jgi:aspartate aminotransferase
MEFISNRASKMEESVTIKMAALATELKEQGKDIISLTLGEPDFNTPDFIKESAKKAIDDNYSSYTPVPGYKDLRQAICNKFKRDNNIDHKINEIVVSTGAKQSLMNVILATVNPGEEVILPAPYWVSYIEMVKFAEGKPVVINSGIETGFKITPEQLDTALNDKTKAFLFSNPCNPSGAAYSKDEIDALVKVFEKYPNTLIISDEIYEYISFAGKNISLASYPSIKDRVVTVNGLSKGYAMTGWRIGYLGAPAAVAKACVKIQGQFTSGANAIAQRAAITALTEDPSKIAFMQEKFLSRRDLMISKLEVIDGLDPGIEIIQEGARSVNDGQEVKIINQDS